MENFSKYIFKADGSVINIKTQRPVTKLRSGKYCLYNDNNKREIISVPVNKQRRSLSKEEIIQIKQLANTESVKHLAARFSTCKSTISKIKNNQTFKNLFK